MTPTTAVPIAPQLTQEYLAASDKDTNPSGRTGYLHPHPPGAQTGDRTTYHPGQALWGYPNDLPPIAYQLNHEAVNRILPNGDLPVQCRDQNGRLMWGVVKDRKKQDKRWPILDFGILPMRISTAVPIFLPVLWMRYDGRIELNDILARMNNSADRPEINTLSMRCARWRFDNCIKSWNDAHGRFTTLKEQEEVEGLLSPQQIQANTTRGLTPGPSHGWGPTVIVPFVSRRDRQAQVEAARDARYFDVNNFSSLSESDMDEDVKQGTNKRSRRSHAQHRKKFRHILKKREAIQEAIQSGNAGQAIVNPRRSALLTSQPGKPMVVKNVIIIPDKDESAFDEDDRALEAEDSEEGGNDEEPDSEENGDGDMEEYGDREKCAGKDKSEWESPDEAGLEDDEEDEADDEAEYVDDDDEEHGSWTMHLDDSTAFSEPSQSIRPLVC